MIIFIMGPQGSGKGTQAMQLAVEFGLEYLDVGSLLRKISKTDAKINEIVNKRGALLPDGEVFKIVTEHLTFESRFDNIILDGYPRSINQYRLLVDWLKDKGSPKVRALFLNITEETAVRRLSARRVDPETGKIYNLITKLPPKSIEERLIQREDDKPEAIKERLKAYHATTEPLVNKLRDEGLLVEVSGEGEIEQIHNEMKADIKKFINEKI